MAHLVEILHFWNDLKLILFAERKSFNAILCDKERKIRPLCENTLWNINLNEENHGGRLHKEKGFL